jgi:hypothetical protein
MGREIKRVALNFDWPLEMTWKGFLNPYHSQECKVCDGTGLGHCPVCRGEGSIWFSDEVKKLSEEWQSYEPPSGEGWQIWETVSEGSPITPVFATKDDLVDYLVEKGDLWDQKRRTGGWKRENAEKFVNRGWSPSMVSVVENGKTQILQPRDGA